MGSAVPFGFKVAPDHPTSSALGLLDQVIADLGTIRSLAAANENNPSLGGLFDKAVADLNAARAGFANPVHKQADVSPNDTVVHAETAHAPSPDADVSPNDT